MKPSYRESLICDVKKLNAKFDKFIESYMAEIAVIERTGYYQDFLDEVACYTGKIVFCNDGIESNSFFKRDFIIDIDGISVRATLSIELSGTRFVLSKHNAPIFVKKEEIKKVFARIDEDTYWPNGYKVGEYQSGGHDFYVTGRLKSCVPDNAVLETYEGKPVIEAKDKEKLRELVQGEPPYVVRVKGKQIKGYAFNNESSIGTVILQDTVKIGHLAFQGCDNLSKVILPPTLKEIGQQAFSGCYSLTEIVIPASVMTIASSAFQYCTGLKSITVKSAELLSEVKLPKDVKIIVQKL